MAYVRDTRRGVLQKFARIMLMGGFPGSMPSSNFASRANGPSGRADRRVSDMARVPDATWHQFVTPARLSRAQSCAHKGLYHPSASKGTIRPLPIAAQARHGPKPQPQTIQGLAAH